MRGFAIASMLLCAGGIAHAQSPDRQNFTNIERGHYLATVGDCFACHTAPGGKPFAGGRPLETPFGTVVSPNITPDNETGIGAWSDERFYRVMHDGMNGGAHLYPAMPYPYYTKVSREDVLAIRAWLSTVEPVKNPVESNQLPFPFDIRAGMIGWNAVHFESGEWRNRPDKSAEWNRGGYLVEGLGHCGACHTPKNILGGDANSRHLQDYALQGWYAPEITNAAHTGLGTWSLDDVVEYLKSGANRLVTASGPMAEEVADSTSHVSLADLRAMAIYLKDQPGSSEQPPPAVEAADPQMKAGQAVFVDNCSACHTTSGNGIARLFPTLKGNVSVQSAQPDNILQVILNGTRAVATRDAPTGPAMPSFGWKLSDEEVAAVATYVRNAWGNAAPPVTPADARNARKAFAAREE
jgi:mono/diheme cytochrome c family protein